MGTPILTLSELGIEDVTIDRDDLAATLEPIINAALKKGRLIPSDVQMYSNTYASAQEAWDDGNRLFDCMAYASMTAAERAKITVIPKPSPAPVISPSEVASAIGMLYMMLMIQAKVPAAGDNIPAFITNYLNIKTDPTTAMAQLASFDLNKLHHDWIKLVDITKLPAEAKSRLGLVVAGHRLMAPFNIYTPEAGGSAEALNARSCIIEYLKGGYSWDIHSYTRSPAVLTTFGTINKNLENILLELYTDAQLNDMVAKKILYRKPVTKDARYNNYINWTIADWTSIGNRIIMS